MIHRFTVGQLRALGSAFLLSCTLFPACTLITDVDREEIEEEGPPIFPELDGGADASVPEPGEGDPVDAGTSDAGETITDAGADGGGDAGGATGDAGADAG